MTSLAASTELQAMDENVGKWPWQLPRVRA